MLKSVNATLGGEPRTALAQKSAVYNTPMVKDVCKPEVDKPIEYALGLGWPGTPRVRQEKD